MEKVQESNQDISPISTSPEPVSQHALSESYAHSDLPPNQCHRHCTTSFRKTLVSLDPVLLTSPVLPYLNTILILAPLSQLNKERTAPATTIVRRSKNRWTKCYRTTLSNLVLVPGPALLCWLRKQIKHYNSA